MAANPPWAIDELILALDLYLARRPHLPGNDDSDVMDLSRILNALPLHTTRPDAERFRNPNGVAMKLANFAALDPMYPGKGLDAGSRLDAEVFDRYSSDRPALQAVARILRAGAGSVGLFPVLPESDEEEVSAEEGRLLYRLHRTRERSAALVTRKKNRVRAAGGHLACEVCAFDFERRYGDLGSGFIECHHIVPLAQLGQATVKLSDLALLCSNCHRMIHRGERWMSIGELRDVLVDAAASP